MERIVWWIALILFGIIVALGLFFLAAAVASNPETAAFVLGLLGFWLFANRLIFGFAQIANLSSSFLQGEEVSKEEVAKKVVKREEEVELKGLKELSVAALLATWRSALEPFKYAYYLGFFLVFLLAVLFELNIISSLLFGPVVEAITLGAAIPTVLVWGLELLADYYLAKALEKGIKELQEPEEGERKE